MKCMLVNIILACGCEDKQLFTQEEVQIGEFGVIPDFQFQAVEILDVFDLKPHQSYRIGEWDYYWDPIAPAGFDFCYQHKDYDGPEDFRAGRGGSWVECDFEINDRWGE